MLNPSDIVVRPESLTERLAAEISAQAPAPPEPTPTIMAERFAPEGQRAPAEGPGRATGEPPVMPVFIPQPAGAASANRWLLVASIFVSLVPTAAILALLWQGMIALPGTSRAPIVLDYDQMADSRLASVGTVPVIVAPPAVEIAVKPEIVLTAPGRLAAKPGDEIAFDVAIDSAETLPARSVIAIRALPEGAMLSQGRPYADAEWNLRPDEIGDLRLKLPPTASGTSDVRVELVAADGSVLASAKTRLDVAPDPKAELILRADESGRVVDLIEHGQKMIDVGYFAGARAYFRRAAEAGSGEAALRLAATFDQEFIDKIGAHGIKADPAEARAWYERAKQLGVEGADEKLKALKEEWTNGDEPSQATEAEGPAPVLAEAEEGDGDIVPVVPVETTAAPASLATTSVPLPAAREEWVALLNYANVRAAPSTTADTLRVAEKGTKLRVTGRQGNWVQVTDPDTAEVGWIYSRFIETAQSPTR
jgi:hypothetical protein